MTALGAMTVPLPIATPRPDDRTGLDDRAGFDMRGRIDMGMRRNAGFTGHRPRRGRCREQQPSDQRKSLLRARMDENGDVGRRLVGGFRRAQDRGRPQRRHQRGVAPAVDEDERIGTAFAGGRQRLDRNVGVAGIDKHRAGQIRDFGRRIPA